MFIIIVIILILDVYSYKGLVRLTRGIAGKPVGKIIYAVFWFITLLFVAGILFAFLQESVARSGKAQKNMYLIAGIMMTIYLPKMVFVGFHFVEDLVRIIAFLVRKTLGRISPPVNNGAVKISRSKFISQTGIILSALPFGTFLFGMMHGKFNYRIYREELWFSDLPKSFHGMRIVQLSDIHIGGLYGAWEKVEAAIDMVNEQNPDLILFTGDLVNDFVEELEGWMEILGKLKAKRGKYSILGNHDYGDYHYWKSDTAKKANLDKIKQAHLELGFQLMLNQSDTLTIDGDKIAIIGVENWGKPPFAQYGDLTLASEGTSGIPFKILLSHDPSHWEAEIMKKTDIQLTFSGHTHGMQFGIQTAKINWSPIQMKYPRWGGLYKENGQYLYVNRGFGYIGYPGRVGMPPEITVVDLYSRG